VNGRYFIVGCLIGALLAVIVYVPLSGSETAFPYDPWADINDDGKIDIRDIAYVAAQFGTYGDPTKNVTVTNWPLIQNVNVTNWPVSTEESKIVWGHYYWRRTFTLPLDETWTFTNRTAGYKRMLMVWTADSGFLIWVKYYIAGKLIYSEGPITMSQGSGLTTFNVANTTEIKITIKNSYSEELSIDLAIYVTASDP